MDHQNLQRLLAVSQQMAKTRALMPLLSYVVEVAIELGKAQWGYIMIVYQSYNLQLARDAQGQDLMNPQISPTLLQKVVETGEPFVNTDRSMICVPLVEQTQVIGVMYLEHHAAFDPAALELLSAFASHASPTIYTALLAHQIKLDMDARLEVVNGDYTVLPALAETIAQRLHVDYVGLVIMQAYGEPFAAHYPHEQQGGEVIPLLYDGLLVGEMRLIKEGWTSTQQSILERIVQQLQTIAYNIMLNQNLKKYRENLVLAREEERRRLSQDLHDELGPSLAAITMGLDTITNLIPRNPDAATHMVSEIKQIAKNLLSEIRRIAYDLRPPVLDHLGLMKALIEIVSHFNRSEKVKIRLKLPPEATHFPAAVEVAVYRIIGEALNNVIRHAQASRCEVELTVEDTSLILDIRDDGIGIPEGTPFSMGLISIQHRVEELGGKFHLSATHGTTLHISIPIVRGF